MRHLHALITVVLAASLGALAVPSAASADPSGDPPVRALAGGGSASTAAVMNALAAQATIDGVPMVASYDAAGSATVTTKSSGSCSISRPTSDAAGLTALRSAVSSGTGCLDFARVAGGDPAAAASGPAMVNVPFAIDAVGYVSGPELPRHLTAANVQRLYRCDPATATIKPMLPAAGSQLRAEWLQFLNISEAQITAGTYPCITAVTATGTPIPENDGRVLIGNAILPYSVANYLSQASGTTADLRGSAQLGGVVDASGQPAVVVNADAYPEDVTFALDRRSTLPRKLSIGSLRTIYTCGVPGVTPLIPGAGPLRSAWAQLLSIPEEDLTNGVNPCVRETQPGSTTVIPPNDGRYLVANSILPYAPSAFTAQLTGVAQDTHGGAQLGTISQGGGTSALPMRLNTAYTPGLVHRVFNVIPDAAVNTSPLNEVFVGPSSLICAQPRIVETYGFAVIPDDAAEPCGTLLRPDVSAAASITTSSSVAALDNGRVAGSGSVTSVRHGRCTAAVSRRNAADGTSITLSVKVTGPNCRVTMSAVFYAASSNQVAPLESRTATYTGSGTLILTHTPGLWAYHQGEVSDLIGHTLRDGSVELKDLSSGAPSGTGYLAINGTPVPGVAAPTIVTGSAGARLSWRASIDIPTYRVYRRNITLGQPFAQIAQIAYDPQQGDTVGYFDSGLADLYKYGYRIEPVGLFNVAGVKSLEVTTTRAVPYRIKHYAALGDSYASGEGGGSYYDGLGGQCHRSEFSYAARFRDPIDAQSVLAYTKLGQARLDLIACSGATTLNVVAGLPGSRPQPHMEPWVSQASPNDPVQGRTLAPDYQVEMLAKANAFMPVDLVTLSIGGNDVGFADVLKECAYTNCLPNEATYATRIDQVLSRLTTTYRKVLAASGDAPLKIIGYPALFPTNGGNNCALNPILAAVVGVNLTTAEMAMLNRLGNRLNSVIATAVAQVNATDGRTTLIDPRGLFAGHDVCAGGDAWIVQLGRLRSAVPGLAKESAHPNPTGWDALSAYIPAQFLGV